jgi:peroxiredoxin
MKYYSSSGLSFTGKLFLAFLMVFVLSCEKESENTTPLMEVEAPEFSLGSLSGMPVMLSDYNDKVVVLFFFGNNCPSCKAAAPAIESMLAAPFASRADYQIIGLDQWNGNAASVQAFKTATGVSFPLLLNAASVAAEYKTTYDRLVVIDKTGNIVFSGTQGAAADIETVKQKVETLLGPSAPGSMQSAPGFTLTSLDGNQVKLSDFSNKVVVLFFFGNNCPSCKAAGPDIESNLLTPFKSRTDYQILGLDQWNGNSSTVEAFKTTTGVTFPLLLNAATVAADYKTTYDRLVVIDKSGKTVFTGSQNAANDIATVKQKVESLL